MSDGDSELSIVQLARSTRDLAREISKLSNYILEPRNGIFARINSHEEYISKLRKLDAITEISKLSEFRKTALDMEKEKRDDVSAMKIALIAGGASILTTIISVALTRFVL